jgi:hypothetical protein
MTYPSFFWVPEAPKHPGVYAYKGYCAKKNCTGDIDEAMQFDTKEACQAWCEANPTPLFVPMEHGIAQMPTAAAQ